MADEAWSHALDALLGVSVGDAFGNRFNERTPTIAGMLLRREIPPSPWRYSDDTLMACSVAAVLRERGHMDAGLLAESFAAHYAPDRGYGPKMREILEAAQTTGASVQDAAARLFGGRGSFGNGAVMRLPPLGAFHAHDPERAAREGMDSAAVTHTHPEAVAGASAISVAAALFAASRGGELDRGALFEAVLDLVPRSDVRAAVERARDLDRSVQPLRAAKQLGADRDISCQVTVPFVLWMATRHADDFEAALWETVGVGGDRDTHAAIVGGILAARLGRGEIPSAWIEATEPLPEWLPE
jgi:ADP-ribosylglycohydrolase